MEEEWKEIPNYSLYKINRDGVVWSKQWDRALKVGITTGLVTLLSDDYIRQRFKPETLVAVLFDKES